MKKNRMVEVPNGIKRVRTFLSTGEIFSATIKDVIKDIRRCSLGYKPHSLQE